MCQCKEDGSKKEKEMSQRQLRKRRRKKYRRKETKRKCKIERGIRKRDQDKKEKVAFDSLNTRQCVTTV
jgi:hypothetical protein